MSVIDTAKIAEPHPKVDEIRDLIYKSFIEQGLEVRAIEVHNDHTGSPGLIRSDTERGDRIIISPYYAERLAAEVFGVSGGRRDRLTQLWGAPIHWWERVG